ncbi:hypothetical protein BN1708_016334 [Verticillium longisporum]|nr:hypothetical protein BN1708_016334 [Verticillium longisporum]
MLGIHH